eukprot:7530436-Heterocapsa_arctica.AAC.1
MEQGVRCLPPQHSTRTLARTAAILNYLSFTSLHSMRQFRGSGVRGSVFVPSTFHVLLQNSTNY